MNRLNESSGSRGMPLDFFAHEAYQRHNRRRQEHLSGLMLPLAGKTVLEIGAGVGDHTSFFIDRGCDVTVTDVREENLSYVRARYPSVNVRLLDIESDPPSDLAPHDVVYAYGLLYHVSDPGAALTRIASVTKDLLLLETCVSFGDFEAINMVAEDSDDPTQAAHGRGCRPTRPWMFNCLKNLFQHVYLPLTQPWHPEFPTDWSSTPPQNSTGLYRSVFIASRHPLDSQLLAEELLNQQTRR